MLRQRPTHASIRQQLNALANNLTTGVKVEDPSQIKSKKDSLKKQYQQVDKKLLREVFRDFAALHSDAQPETSQGRCLKGRDQ